MKEAVQMVEKRKEHATQAHIPAAQEIPFEGFTQTEQKIMLILYYSYHGLTGWQVSAKGALPVILLTLGAAIAWVHG